MDNLPEHFQKSLNQIHLESGAKARMREKLLSHMRAHPHATPSPYQRFFSTGSPFTAWLRTPALAAILLLVTAGGVTTFASEGSLPGDPLYPIKVSLLEPARGVFAFTPEAKVDLGISLAETRLREVEELSKRGSFTREENEKSSERFDDSVRRLEASLDDLSRTNPGVATERDASFSLKLDEHRTRLVMLSGEASTTEDTPTRLFVKRFDQVTKLRGGEREKEDRRDDSKTSDDQDSAGKRSDDSRSEGQRGEGVKPTDDSPSESDSSSDVSDDHSSSSGEVEVEIEVESETHQSGKDDSDDDSKKRGVRDLFNWGL